jgi:hypothetical protein
MNGFNSAIPSTLFSTFMRCILAGIGLIWTVLSNPADDIKAGQEQGFQSYLKEAWDRIPSVQMSERVCVVVFTTSYRGCRHSPVQGRYLQWRAATPTDRAKLSTRIRDGFCASAAYQD